MDWITKEVVLAIQAESVRHFGGQPGLRDEGLLESALARPQQRHAYDEAATIADLAAAYCVGIVKNHPFIDGNKRAGFLAADTFLRLNGKMIDAAQTEIVLMIEGLAAGRVSEEEVARWIAKNTAPRR